VKRTQTYTIDGKTYASPEEMPPEIRKKWETVSSLLAKVAADLAANPSKQGTYKFQERAVLGPGESPDELVLQSMRPNGLSDLTPATTPPGAAPTDRRSQSIRVATLALLLPVLLLAVWSMLSPVRITMPYGPTWWVVSAGVALVLTAALTWGWKHRPIATLGGPEDRRITFGSLLALALGMSALSFLGIPGGLPLIAHHLTAENGTLVVTVTGKNTHYARYHCVPQLKIAEFTYRLKDYLCPTDRAFNEIQVGAKVRLEGEVSAFGIEPDVMTWSNPK